MATTFGIKTSPTHTSYEDLLHVWEDADAIPEIGSAWLFDHLLPIYGAPLGSMHEGWTLLAALAARTARLRIGHIVTSNRFRPPALLAKMAAEVDVISGGRVILGLGAGSVPLPGARREYDAFGLPYASSRDAASSFAESCEIIRRLWVEPEPFNFGGQHHQLTGAYLNPKPVQARPPLLIGGWSPRTLRIAAEHADLWNPPGPDLDEIARRSEQLDGYCEAIGRDPRDISRIAQVGVGYDETSTAVVRARELIGAGFGHIVFVLPAPYPVDAARLVADEIIGQIG